VAEKTAQTIYIDADPSTVMDVIADIGSYPDWVSEYTEAVDKAVANPRAGDGFRRLILDLCELQARDAGLRDLLTTAFPATSAVELRTGEAVQKVKSLIACAQDEGSVRSDLVVADVVVMLLANAGVLAGSYRSIQISGQKALGTFAIHLSHPLIGCEPNDAREDSFSG